MIPHPPKKNGDGAQPVKFANCASHKKFDDFQGRRGLSRYIVAQW
jgi:hypothetical protein